MLYSNNSPQVRQSLVNNTQIPHSLDYPFFAGMLINALENKGRVSIIPYSPFGQGIGDDVIDADYQNTNGTESITLIFNENKQFHFYLNRQEITQPGCNIVTKFYVNDSNNNQEINITFI